jgi:hypothetical protein
MPSIRQILHRNLVPRRWRRAAVIGNAASAYLFFVLLTWYVAWVAFGMLSGDVPVGFFAFFWIAFVGALAGWCIRDAWRITRWLSATRHSAFRAYTPPQP